LTIIEKQNIKIYLGCFSISMTISIFVSYLLFFNLLTEFNGHQAAENPTPFMDHITYGLFLTFYIYGLINAYRNSRITFHKFIFTSLIIFSVGIIFLTGGRGMQLSFLLLIPIMLFYYKGISIRSTLKIFFLTISLITIAFNFSNIFNSRVNSGIEEFKAYFDGDKFSKKSIVMRLNYLENSSRVFINLPLIGVGTGDFPDQYEFYRKRFTPDANSTVDPHNMHILVLANLGLLGYIFFLNIFRVQYKKTYPSDKLLNGFNILIPTSFIIICFFGSYLIGHHSSMLFIFFSALVYLLNDK